MFGNRVPREEHRNSGAEVIVRCSNAFLLCGLIGLLIGCTRQPRVVVYAALDQLFSEPILAQFEAETGIKVLAQFDTEAQKTVGLYRRLVAERAAPQCDVWWNNEIVHTILLQQQGLLEPYASPSAVDIPPAFQATDRTWTGFAARARVLIYNREVIPNASDVPQSIRDLADPRWRGRATLANPLFGTTSTHVAALFALLGPSAAAQLLDDMKKNDVVISAGNATVRDRVAAGELALGLTDTDDAHGALLDGKPVGIVFPDADGMGTLLIPNTLALIRHCPHPEQGRRLIDYLLRPEIEAALARGRSAQIPVRRNVPGPPDLPGLEAMRVMAVDYSAVADQMEPSRRYVEERFLVP